MGNKKRARKLKQAQANREQAAAAAGAAVSGGGGAAPEKKAAAASSSRIHGFADEDTECSSRNSRDSESSRRSSDSYSDSESDYADDDDSDDSHEWCIHCKSLIQMPIYEKHAHFHSGRFDMWLCHKCFPIDMSNEKTCKCVMHCTACGRDVLYTDDCIPFYNTSRGFCDTCSNNLKRVARGNASPKK